MKIFFLHITLLFSFIFSQSSLSERYTTYQELENKIIEWDQNYGSNSDPFPNIPNEGIIFHHEIIGYSGVDNLPIWAIKLSFNANIDEDEPKIVKSKNIILFFGIVELSIRLLLQIVATD